MSAVDELMQRFLSMPPVAVVGASSDMDKYGARVFAALRREGISAYPVNPRHSEIQGERAYASLADLPAPARSVSVITPPEVTEDIVEQAGELDVEILWLQPGAESAAAVTRATKLGMDVIHGGPCILVQLSLGQS